MKLIRNIDDVNLNECSSKERWEREREKEKEKEPEARSEASQLASSGGGEVRGRGCSDAKHYERMTHSFVGLLILRGYNRCSRVVHQPRQPRQPRQRTTATRHAMPRPTATGETIVMTLATELTDIG